MVRDVRRWWVLCAAGLFFLCGGSLGLLVGLRLNPPPREPRPFADYETLLTREFELDGLRVEGLHAVLDRYHRDVEDAKSRHMAELRDEIAELGRTATRRIRDKVLPPERQADFDRLVAGSLSPIE